MSATLNDKKPGTKQHVRYLLRSEKHSKHEQLSMRLYVAYWKGLGGVHVAPATVSYGEEIEQWR